MKKNENTPVNLPSMAQIEQERDRIRHRGNYNKTLRSTIAILLVVAATAVLVAMLWMPVLRIYGSSMTPTLEDGQIVIAVKSNNFDEGDVVAFYYGNKLLVKRYIAGAADWVDIDLDGNVLVNGELLEEKYLDHKSYGDSNITFPYQIPDDRYFVLGDNREDSIDSRNTIVGCVAQEQIVGKVVFCVWPLRDFGPIK